MVARAFERDSLFSLIAGPLVWTAHFLTLYIFTAIACAHGFFDHEILGVRVVPLVGGAVTAARGGADPGRAGALLSPLARHALRTASPRPCRRTTRTTSPAAAASWPMPACCCPASP